MIATIMREYRVRMDILLGDDADETFKRAWCAIGGV